MLKYPSSRTAPTGSSWRNAARRDPLGLASRFPPARHTRTPFPTHTERTRGKNSPPRLFQTTQGSASPGEAARPEGHHGPLDAGPTPGAIPCQVPYDASRFPDPPLADRVGNSRFHGDGMARLCYSCNAFNSPKTAKPRARAVC